MTRIILIFTLWAFTTQAHAQIGIAAAASTTRVEDWQVAFQEEYGGTGKLFLSGYDLGVNYWFRLKKKRIEFFPTISRSEYKTYYDTDGDITVIEELITFKTAFTGFHFDTRIYPFDFGSDCDCPVWSKQNDLLKKGFFIMLSPGVDFVQTILQDKSTNSWLPTASGGMGLDIGISDFLTVTPFVTARYTPAVDGNVLFPNTSVGNNIQDVVRLIGGLSVNLRFDDDKY